MADKKLPGDGGEPLGILPDGKPNVVSADAPPFKPRIVTPEQEGNLDDLDEIEELLAGGS